MGESSRRSRRATTGAAALAALGLLLGGCASSGGPAPLGGVDQLVVPSPSPAPDDFVGTEEAAETGGNAWYPMAVGSRWEYATPSGARLEVLVTGSGVVAGVPVWSVRTTVSDHGADPEVHTDQLATDRAGNLWLLGQEFAERTGSWRASGEVGAGLYWPADPRVGDGWWRARVPARWQVTAQVVERQAQVHTPAGTFTDVVVSTQKDALHPLGTDRITWARGTGPVQFRLGSGQVFDLTAHTVGPAQP